MPVRSKYSCSSGVVPKQAAQTLSAFDATADGAVRPDRLREQQNISFTLMVPLTVKVRNVLAQRPPE